MLRDLCWGMQGLDVAAVQEALEMQPVTLPHGPLRPRGIFGPKTDAAVRAFQKLKHLKVDGIVGSKTRAALYPYGVARLHVSVSKTPGPVANPSEGKVLPSSHPAGPVTLTRLPGLSIDLPSPLVIPAPTQRIQIKAGNQVSYRLQQSPAPSKPSSPLTDTLVLDLVGLIYTPSDLKLGALHGPATMGFDLAVTDQVYGPAKYTATLSYGVTLAPELFRYGHWQWAAIAAKAGAGYVWQDSSPKSYLSFSGSLGASVSYNLGWLKIVAQPGLSLSLDHRDSHVHATTSLTGFLGVQGGL